MFPFLKIFGNKNCIFSCTPGNFAKKMSFFLSFGATLLQFVKTQEKDSSFSKIFRGTPKYTIFITKYFQKWEHFGKKN